VQIPPGTDDQTRAGMEQMKDAFANQDFILPEEAIGTGAKWEVRNKKQKQGMTMDETIRHELVSMDGTVMVVKSATTQSAANQKVPNPFMPTAKIDLTKMTGTATESATIDLANILPSKATAEERTETILTTTTAGKRQAMTLKTETHSTLESD
jgi:hypothetical protein